MKRSTHRIASALACLLVAGLAAPAWSATVVKMRVGQHPNFTRVVFELESAAGYRLRRSVAEDGRPVVIVTLAATLGESVPRNVRSGSSLLESVSIAQPQDRAVATIRLRRAELPIKEMILGSPPRIVLDVVGEDTALAKLTRPKAPKAAPAPEKPVAKAPAPEPEPLVPTPTPAVPEPTKPEPLVPTPTPAVPEPPKPEPQPEPVAQPPEPAAEPERAEKPDADREAERAAQEAMDRRLAAVREAAEKRRRQLEQERQAREAKPPAPAPTAVDENGGPSLLLVGAGAGLLVVVVIIMAVVLARRRSLPKDLDVAMLGVPGEEPSPAEEQPAAIPGAEPLVGQKPTPPLSAPGLFEEPEKGESAMETHVQDLPMDRSQPVGPSPGADFANVISELERRVTQLESRLQESNAARERLERQVAAQSEELRVQRAAIARTQRALRGLSRSEEEQATEPALRD